MALVMATEPSHAKCDLHGFLSNTHLERHHHYRLEQQQQHHHQQQQQQEMKKEIGGLSKRLKKEEHQTVFGRLRHKTKPVKSFSQESQGSTPTPPVVVPRAATTTPSPSPPPSSSSSSSTTTTTRAAAAGTVGACSSCGSSLCVNCARREVSWLTTQNQNREYTNCEPQNKTVDKRGVLKCSVSAVSDRAPTGHQQLSCGHSTVHPSCVSGQRLAQWRDPGCEPESAKELPKRLSLRIDDIRPRTPSGKVDNEAKPASTMSEVLTVLGGPPYHGPEVAIPTDRSPLIEHDKPSFPGARNSFDNMAATDTSSISRNSSEAKLQMAQDGRSIQSHLPLTNGEPAQKQTNSSVARHQDAKKKKWFPALRIKIPENEEPEVGPKVNIKKLSAAQERYIDEVLELAETFGRLGSNDHVASTPRTPGASSKESKESLTGSTESPTTHFRFNIFKSRKEEKKTFAEELAAHLTDPSSMLTPEALDAYEKLVAKSEFEDKEEEDANGKKSRPAKQSSRQVHRHGLRMKLLKRIHPHRSSLSESDKGTVQPEVDCKSQDTGSSGRSVRFGSTGSTLTQTKGNCEQSLFSWFDKSPLNTTKRESRVRPKSLQSDLGVSVFPLTMPLPLPLSHLPPPPPRRDGNETTATSHGGGGGGGGRQKTETSRRTPPPIPVEVENIAPPPALPPRIPLRQSTINSKPRQRCFPLSPESPAPRSTDKQRSHSEEGSQVTGHRFNHYYTFRGEARSTATDDGSMFCSEPHSPTTPNQLNCTHGSNDSVFDHHLTKCPGSTIAQSPIRSNLSQYRSLSVKNVKVNAKELGISDQNDPFWRKNGSFDLSECYSESDLLREALAPIPGRYETSDCISYEDLMEFALDGPQNKDSYRRNESDFPDCDEIRLMRKMFSNDVTVDDCMQALVETSWNVLLAVKLVKLKQLLATGLGSQDQCKDALMACKWNVDEAAAFLLSPPSE